MLATLPAQPPKLTDPAYVYEPKVDGIRAIVEVLPRVKAARGQPAAQPSVRFWSRNGNEKTAQFPDIAEAIGAWLTTIDAPIVLDGEIVALDEEMRPASFQRLQHRIHIAVPGFHSTKKILPPGEQPAAFVAFDLLRDGDADLRHLALTERRARLEALFAKHGLPVSGIVRITAQTAGDGTALLTQATDEHWEGLMVKLARSPYRTAPTSMSCIGPRTCSSLSTTRTRSIVTYSPSCDSVAQVSHVAALNMVQIRPAPCRWRPGGWYVRIWRHIDCSPSLGRSWCLTYVSGLLRESSESHAGPCGSMLPFPHDALHWHATWNGRHGRTPLAERESSKPRRQRVTVLVVGSRLGTTERGVRIAIERSAQSAVFVTTKEEALAATLVETPRCVLVDAHAGIRDIHEALRSRAECFGVPVIALTDFTSEQAWLELHGLGADDVAASHDLGGITRRLSALSTFDPAARTALFQGTCLVAHQDPYRRTLLGRVLRQGGFDVAFASNTAEALDIAERSPPKVVVAASRLPPGGDARRCKALAGNG